MVEVRLVVVVAVGLIGVSSAEIDSTAVSIEAADAMAAEIWDEFSMATSAVPARTVWVTVTVAGGPQSERLSSKRG